MSEVKINKQKTHAIRKAAAKSSAKTSQVTINFDVDILNQIRKMAKPKGTPYQALLGRIVIDSLKNKKSQEDRLAHLEKEVQLLKKKLA